MNITEMAPMTKSATLPPRGGVAVPDLQRPHVAAAVANERKGQQAEQRPEETGKNSTREAREELQSAVNQLNQTANVFHRAVRFNLSDESGRVQVNVVDTDSDKIIRQIPPKETLNVAKRIKDFLGILLDEKR